MTKSSNPNLRPNPFNTYRDPKTGLWVVVQSANVTQLSTANPSQKFQEVQSTESQKV
ncbi:hypothetical protein PCC7424_0087 [Gloeothece citriformis PCC 7424]|uniref:Uncharacterized protein n=1 Tax=Gloeothece citriformis (strain PCC 7424) TaxID=65393 RepID=B7K974_GLOC7|nr:hypothetical protein [Gloeothece citriformis]ACK68557.1 hypothetical protein PCC7424_0087 [Gloeothece citriformis PCC 7424]